MNFEMPTRTDVNGVTRQLRRNMREKAIAGVAAGVGTYLGIDPVAVRVLLILAGFVTGPLALGAYIACWVVMPRDDEMIGTTL